MTQQFVAYPSTPSFKDIITRVKRLSGKPTFLGLDPSTNEPMFEPVKQPVLRFTGTVKIHGTHGDVHRLNGELVVQSRNRVLSLESDNCGFYAFVMANRKIFDNMLDQLQAQGKPEFLSGEFAGSNIQHGVAVTGMPKTFFVFNEGIYPVADQCNVFSIYQFNTYQVDIDFNKVEKAWELLEELTLMVEEKCPVGTILNADSDNTVGEGIVWKTTYKDKLLVFKTKGVKHARVAKVKIPQVRADSEAVKTLVTEFVTGDRLEQGIEYLLEMGTTLDRKATGTYIGWVTSDVFKECQERLVELNLTGAWKQVSAEITQVARSYFLARVDLLE